MSVLDLQVIVREAGLFGHYPELITHADKKAALVINTYRTRYTPNVSIDSLLECAAVALKTCADIGPNDPCWKSWYQAHSDAIRYADALSHMHTRVEAICEERKRQLSQYVVLEETPVLAVTNTPPGMVIG